MTNIHIVDANVILRYLLADHAVHHQKAKAFLNEVREGSSAAFFPETVIAECVYVMQRIYQIPRAEIAEKLSGLLSFRGVEGHEPLLQVRALQLYAERNLSFVDALIAVTAKENHWSIQTFDQDLIKWAND